MRATNVSYLVKITGIEGAPLVELRGLNAAGGGLVESIVLPVLEGVVTGLPRGLDALLVASDLQALESVQPGRPPRLLGERLAEELAELAPPRTGVLLAGDLYTVPDLRKRGGLGDVSSVWRAFEERFDWVVGVRGNHDLLEPRPGLLDGGRVERGGLAIGGVSGIVGNPRKPNRRAAEAFVELVLDLLVGAPDVLVLHEGPETAAGPGDADLAALLADHGRELLVVCGHSHWDSPLGAVSPRVQVLNVDARAVLLRRAE